MATPKPPRADRPKQPAERRSGTEKPVTVDPVDETPAPDLLDDQQQRLNELVPGTDGDVKVFVEWVGRLEQRISFVDTAWLNLKDARTVGVLPAQDAKRRADVSRAAQKLVDIAKESPTCFGYEWIVRIGNPLVDMIWTAQLLADDAGDETGFNKFCAAAPLLKRELQAALRVAQMQVRRRQRNKSPSTNARVEAAIKRYAVEQLLRDDKTAPVAPATTPPAAPSSGVKPVDDVAETVKRLCLLLGSDFGKIMTIVSHPKLTTEQKLRALGTLDERFKGYSSPALCELLRVSPGSVTNSDAWKEWNPKPTKREKSAQK